METAFTTKTKASCLNLMPVDTRLLEGDLLARWREHHANNCCEPYLSTPETDYTDKAYFNLDSLESFTAQAGWIRDFRQAIWYEEAKYYIEAAHRVKNRDTLRRIGGVQSDFASCDLNRIREVVRNYDQDRYDQYVEFELAATNAIPTPHSEHQPGRFSVQLLKSIVAVKELGPNPRFDFFNNQNIQFFRVQNEKGFIYYDFSDNPKLLLV